MIVRCDPGTLRPDPCLGGCGRLLHVTVNETRGTNAACEARHPRHVGRGLCSACRARIARDGDLADYPPLRDHRVADESPRGAAWRRQAACAGADPTEFTPDRRTSSKLLAQLRATAEMYCACCPVIGECAALADADRLTGLYGGAYRWRSNKQWERALLLAEDRCSA